MTDGSAGAVHISPDVEIQARAFPDRLLDLIIVLKAVEPDLSSVMRPGFSRMTHRTGPVPGQGDDDARRVRILAQLAKIGASDIVPLDNALSVRALVEPAQLERLAKFEDVLEILMNARLK